VYSFAPMLQVLAQMPYFRPLPRPLLERLAAGCARVELRRGETLFLQGAPARAFYVVETGTVRVFRSTPDGQEQVIHHVRPGQSFAEAAVFNFGRYPVHAQARSTPTVVVAIPGEHFLALLGEDPRMGAAMIGALCQRLRELVDRVEELGAVDGPTRLARYLLRLPAQALAGGGFAVRLPVAKKDLAAELSLRPETLSRLLGRWRRDGVIRGTGATLILARVEDLEALADQA